MGPLMADPAFTATTFVVIDFEATTPTGHPAQPIEVAALALTCRDGRWGAEGEFESLMRPPDFAPLTPFDTQQTGITPAMLDQAPLPEQAMAALDSRLTGGPYLLVAHHASTEGNLIYLARDHCPRLAATDLIDTIPLAKRVLPGKPDYRLDTLLDHYGIAKPVDRHRAMADVRVTADLFARLLTEAETTGTPTTLHHLTRVAGRRAKANEPVQNSLF
ncbi:3'-5' exonuclease [Streptomyces sp. NPDC055103]